MTLARPPALSRRLTRSLLASVGAYILTWFLTHFAAIQPIVRTVEARLPLDSSYRYTDVIRMVRNSTEPVYYLRAQACGPFLVRADYAWRSGPHYAEGRSVLFVWLFGLTFEIQELERWSIESGGD